jgi:AcrR family transcriptional regulator
VPDVRGYQRARAPEQKEDRRHTILQVAQDELNTSSFAELTMARLAEKVGVAKGTLYLYFETKEELLLALVEELLGNWFGEIRRKLGKGKSKPEAVARITASSLLRQDALGHLLPVAMSVAEQNGAQPWVADYRARVLRECRTLAKALESFAPGIAPGGGLRFLLYAFGLLTGLRHLSPNGSSPAKPARTAYNARALRQPIEREFAASLVIVMRGLVGG